MDNLLTLAVILILTILGSAIIMSEAIARLTAAVSTIGLAVARLGTEVTETAEAIRNHLTGDSGISQTELLAQVDKLDAAGAAINEAGDQLNSLQGELGGGSDAPASDVPAGDVPASDVPASDVSGETASPEAASGDGFGNQSGIGSEFEQGAGGDHIDLNSQSDTPADANNGQPANEPSVDAGNGQPDDKSDPE